MMDDFIRKRFADAVGWRCIAPPGLFSPDSGSIAVTDTDNGITLTANAMDVFEAFGMDPEALRHIFRNGPRLETGSRVEIDADSPYAGLRNRYFTLTDWSGWFRLARLAGKPLKVVLRPSVDHDGSAIIAIDPHQMIYAFGEEYARQIKPHMLSLFQHQIAEIIARLREE